MYFDKYGKNNENYNIFFADKVGVLNVKRCKIWEEILKTCQSKFIKIEKLIIIKLYRNYKLTKKLLNILYNSKNGIY